MVQKHLLERPFNLFLPTVAILTALAPFVKNEFGIRFDKLFIYLSAFFIVFWVVYFLIFEILYSKYLTWIHVGLTILTSILFFVYLGMLAQAQVPRRYYSFDTFQAFSEFDDVNRMLIYTVYLFISGQIIFFVNVVAGIIKTRNPK